MTSSWTSVGSASSPVPWLSSLSWPGAHINAIWGLGALVGCCGAFLLLSRAIDVGHSMDPDGAMLSDLEAP